MRSLRSPVHAVAAGEIYPVPLPWRTLGDLTHALLPGTVVVLAGDPGAGKTFFILGLLRYWTEHGHDAVAFFLEKNKTFYLRRLLAQERPGRSILTTVREKTWRKPRLHSIRSALRAGS